MKRISSSILVWIVAVCLSLSIAASTTTDAQEKVQQQQPSSILLTNARIFDVEAGTLDDNKTSILIVGKKISVINSDAQPDPPSENTTVINLDGRVVLPGLIDLHSHLLLHPYDETTWNDQVLKESLELRTIRGTVAARRTLEAGFTTLRDLGTEGAAFADVAIRDSIKQGIIPGPRIFAVTKALVTSGGYGPMGFDPRWEMPVGAQTADGVAECRKATRQQIAAGADWIKVYADYRRRPGDPSTPTFSQEELDAIVAEATTAGIPVAAHAATDEGIRRSVNAGVKTIEHGYEASPEALALMRENGVVLCPTLTASESIARYNGWNPEIDPDHPRVTTAKTLMKNALNSGVTIACGSDVGVFAHGDNARELELMFAYGMPADEVVRSATINAANVLKQEDLGVVNEKMLADLIVVQDDPTKIISTLRKPLIVIKDGFLEVDLLFESSDMTDVAPEVSPDTSSEESNDVSIDAERSYRPTPSLVAPKESTRTNPGWKLDRLDLDSDKPMIIDVPKDAPEVAGEPKKVFGNGKTVVLRLEKDGGFSFDGKSITKGDLSRKLMAEFATGIRQVRVQITDAIEYERLPKTQEWLTELDFESVLFESVDK